MSDRNSLKETEAYERLGAAIVAQACRDAMSHPAEVRRFFCDGKSIFDICMPTADGEAVWKQVRENYRKYGKYIAGNGAPAYES
ncbi:MAG: hypothetical protein K5770_19065 [Lachnospiraceae bacterium]|nr:hypothetical protein [Lachnospiraceae bacterium]